MTTVYVNNDPLLHRAPGVTTVMMMISIHLYYSLQSSARTYLSQILRLMQGACAAMAGCAWIGDNTSFHDPVEGYHGVAPVGAGWHVGHHVVVRWARVWLSSIAEQHGQGRPPRA